MTEHIELRPCPILSLGFGVTPIADRLRNIADGELLRIPSRDEENFFLVSRTGDMVQVAIEGKILGTMKEFVVEFYSRLERVHSSLPTTQQVQFSLQQWHDVWDYHPASIVFINTAL